jgi:3D (Asp-Asp-Asp) domain-containing protein
LRKLLLLVIIIVSFANSSFTPYLEYTATAYSLRGATASGARVRRGIVAADTRLHRIGSFINIQAGQYSGNYRVMDTGGAIRGRKLDIYVPSIREAVRFGRQKVLVRKI